MHADGTNQKKLSNTGWGYRPALSPDGSQVVFEGDYNELDVLDIANGTRLKIAGGLPCCASWSPDGSRIAFTNSTGTYNPREVFVINSDGTNLRQVTTGSYVTGTGFSKFMDAWSVDGTQLLITALFDNQANPTTALYVVDIDGNNMVPLPAPGGVGIAADWSPDGKTIAYTADGGYIGLSTSRYPGVMHRMNIDGTGQVQLTVDTSRDDSPHWSPDGSQIVFSSERDGHSQIYVMNADGSAQRPLVVSSTRDFYPNWRRP